MNYIVLFFYFIGVATLLSVVIYSIFSKLRARRHSVEPLHEQIATTAPQVLQYKETSVVLAEAFEMRSKLYSGALGKIHPVRELALDANIGILQATRKSEKKLAKAEAQKLLDILREELGIAKDETPEHSIQAIRTRLMNLTEMMAEAQVSLCDIDHRVVDLEAIVDQLPDILQTHRDHICSLQEAVSEIQDKGATKSELSLVEKELRFLKWAFVTIFGVVFTLLGWIFSKVF